MAPKKAKAPVEKRIDPSDGETYSYDQMAKYYAGTYKKAGIQSYWECCKLANEPKPKAKAKAKAKAKVKKEPKPLKVIKVGDTFPETELHLGFPPEKINMVERLKEKKVPEYLKRQDELKAKGVSEVIVYCVNDGAVMKGWAKDQGIEGSMITFMGDPSCKFSRKLGMVIRHPGPRSVLGNPRCKRFVLVVDNGEVKAVEISEAEDDPAGDNDPSGPVTAKTRVDHVLELL